MNAIISTKEGAAQALFELAEADPKVVLVTPDSLKAIKAMRFQATFPERSFEVGIAEQHAVTFAAGLASCGYKPFVAAYGTFISMRACEQVRTFVAYPGLNVKFIAMCGGVFGGERDGVTHQALEDLAIMRAIPGMDVVVPADGEQARLALKALARRPNPGYMRIGSGLETEGLSGVSGFEFGRIRVLADHGADAALFVCGAPVLRALAAAKALAEDGIRVKVVEVHTLKPLDAEGIAAVLAECGVAVTVEDHMITGGLGSAIAEVIAERQPARLTRVGLADSFPESGEGNALMDKYGLAVGDIAAAVRRAVKA